MGGLIDQVTSYCHRTDSTVSSPDVLDPTLAEGKGSGELGLNPRFSLYGARRQGHGSDWLLWQPAVKQTLNLIGQRN